MAESLWCHGGGRGKMRSGQNGNSDGRPRCPGDKIKNGRTSKTCRSTAQSEAGMSKTPGGGQSGMITAKMQRTTRK